MSQPGKQITKIHILPNASGSKGNDTMKFGGETITIPFLFEKVKIEHIFGLLV